MTNDQSHDRWQASIGNEATPFSGTDLVGKDPVHKDPVRNATEPAVLAAGLAPDASAWSKKTVLLVDINSHTRDARAKIMRTLGVTVHCASSVGAARSRLESASYNLVLLDLGTDVDGAEQLAAEIKHKKPRQLVGFLVGSPLFVATSLSGNIARRARVGSPAPEVPVQKVNPPNAIDFGQKIRDAEAEEIA